MEMNVSFLGGEKREQTYAGRISVLSAEADWEVIRGVQSLGKKIAQGLFHFQRTEKAPLTWSLNENRPVVGGLENWQGNVQKEGPDKQFQLKALKGFRQNRDNTVVCFRKHIWPLYRGDKRKYRQWTLVLSQSSGGIWRARPRKVWPG